MNNRFATLAFNPFVSSVTLLWSFLFLFQILLPFLNFTQQNLASDVLESRLSYSAFFAELENLDSLVSRLFANFDTLD